MAQAAVGNDCCVFAAALHDEAHDYFDPDWPYCRFYIYKSGSWTCAEIKAQIVSIMPYREADWEEPSLAVLEGDGRIWFLGKRGYETRVANPDATLLQAIRQFDGKLFVSGHRGQIYRRDADGWHHDDQGLFNADPSIPRPRPGDHGKRYSEKDLIRTPSGLEYYSCGCIHIARPALFNRRANEDWHWLGVDPDDPTLDYLDLTGAYAESDDLVWISTNKGFLLKGNSRAGFRRGTSTLLDRTGSPVEFTNFVKFGQSLFIGGTVVCRLLPDGTLDPQVGPPVTRMGFPDKVTSSIEGVLGAAGDVLWSIGAGVLSRFDGRTWDRILMPTVYRNNRRYKDPIP